MKYLLMGLLLLTSATAFACRSGDTVKCGDTAGCGSYDKHGDFSGEDWTPTAATLAFANQFVAKDQICIGGWVDLDFRITNPGGYTEYDGAFAVGPSGQAVFQFVDVDHEQVPVKPKSGCDQITGFTCVAGTEIANGSVPVEVDAYTAD